MAFTQRACLDILWTEELGLGYSPESCKELDVAEATSRTHAYCHQVAGCHSNSSKQGPSLIQDYLNLYPLLQMIL